MMDLYSGNRNEINSKLTESLNKELHEQFGIQVIDASIIDVHPDAQLQKTISDRVTALQKQQQARAEQQTIKVQNETALMQAQAEADKREIKAKSDAEVKRIAAEAEAEALRIAAEAEAEANEKINASLTAQLLEKIKYEQWNGQLPKITGDTTPIVDVSAID